MMQPGLPNPGPGGLVREFRILAFGASNVMGYGLDDTAKCWPMLVGSAIQAAHGHPVTVVRLPLYLEGTDPGPYISKKLDEHNPDLVLFNASGPAFVLKTVANSVGRFAGKRVRRAVILGEVQLQNLFGSLGDRNVPVRRFLKRGLRKAAGARTRVTVADGIFAGTHAVKVLAAHESVSTVVRVPLEAASWVYEEQGEEQVALYMDFRDAIRIATASARMTWVEDSFTLSREEERLVYIADGIHLSEAGHVRAAQLWLPAALRECERSH